jgi:hypothetical protein
MDSDALECQQCGTVLKRLSPAESQRVALNPYGFVAFCGPCGSERHQKESPLARASRLLSEEQDAAR